MLNLTCVRQYLLEEAVKYFIKFRLHPIKIYRFMLHDTFALCWTMLMMTHLLSHVTIINN
jgi:hypothetical protein